MLGWFSPHPPILIPEIGRDDGQAAADTDRAMRQAAKKVVDSQPDVVVIFGPHGAAFDDAFTVELPGQLTGGFAAFGAPQAMVTVKVHAELTESILQLAEAAKLPLYGLVKKLRQRFHLSAELNHGVTVPLWYLQDAYVGPIPPVVIINISGLSLEEHYRLGTIIQSAIAENQLRAVIIGSGDLSHRLTFDAPAGYHPEAHQFDEAVVDLFRHQKVAELLRLEDLSGCAGECGLRPLAVFLGCFDGLLSASEVLSYQAPFGVGYLVGLWTVQPGAGGHYQQELDQQRSARVARRRERESSAVLLARSVVESFVRREPLPEDAPKPPATLPARAGVFVSIKKHGQLRGCIGTTGPTEPTLTAEIIQNAISAASRDPRFEPIEESELAALTYSVDVLGAPESIADQSELDVKRYGVIVQSCGKQGLLLPDLSGVDSVEEQVNIAKQKAGIRPGESFTLARFTVTRFE